MIMPQKIWLKAAFVIFLMLVGYGIGVKTAYLFNSNVKEKIDPILQPNMSALAIQNWAAKAAVGLYTLDFKHYKNQLQDVSAYFTPKSWLRYQKALKASKLIDNIISNKYLVSAVPTGAALILKQGVEGGRYTWQVQVPLLVTYSGPVTTTKRNILVSLFIQRTRQFIGQGGVGIVSVVAKEVKS
jgi:intracellular multiplication protein IcmL